MNPDYAHLLPDAEIDFNRLALAIRAYGNRPETSFRMLARQAGIDEKVVRYASRGNRVSAQTYLKFCVALDLNPFEGLVKRTSVSREYTGSAPLVNRGVNDG